MDATSGETLNQFERQAGAPFAFTQDWGSLVVIGYNDTAISVWDPFSAELLQLLEHPETVFNFWLSPDERYLASLTFEGRVTLWDLATGVSLAELTSEEASGDWLTFSPQGDRLALLLSNGRISLWDVVSATETLILDCQATRLLQFSPDGSLLLTVSAQDGLQVWDTITGEELDLDLPAIDAEITPSFVYGGRLLAIQNAGELQLWGAE